MRERKQSAFMKTVQLVLLSVLVAPVTANASVPDFGVIKDVKQKKKAFFNYFRPIIQEINQTRQKEREELKQIAKVLKSGKKISASEQNKLKAWAERYGVEYSAEKAAAVVEKLMLHLDQIPASMVLAQAANESAWGTSRFAKLGNNFFGQWCYKKGCGIVPSARDKGTRHEVRKFSSPRESVLAYFRNINSHRTYKPVRKIRAELRAKGEKLSGIKMVAGLVNYSQRREAYVKELRAMIRYNKLEK